MQGALVDTPPADLFVRLAGQSATGTLTLSGPDGDGDVQFIHGAIAAARARTDGRSRGLRLGERLVHAGRLEADDLDRVLADQAAATAPVALGHLLVERGLVSADVVRLLLQEQALDALTELLTWRGSFSFEVDPAPATRLRVALPVDRALVEIRRRDRERQRVGSLVPGPGAIPRPTDADHSAVRLSPDAVSVLTAVDGRISVGAIASTLGYGYDEASRIVYRLALQGLLELEAANGSAPTPSHTEPAPVPDEVDGASPVEQPGAATPEAASSEPAWAETADTASHDEPHPWVGWARGGPDTPADTDELEGDQRSERPGAEESATADDRLFATVRPASRDVDETTRRELFSELHAVSRAETEDPPSRPAAPSHPEQPPEPDPRAEQEDPEPEPDVPTERPMSELSGDELSSLLRELHDLNRDDGGG